MKSIVLLASFVLALPAVGCAAKATVRPAIVAAPSTPRVKLMGTWKIVLTQQEARLMEIAKIALSSTQGRADLEKISPTAEELDVYDAIVSMDLAMDPRLERIESELRRADSVITVTSDEVAYLPSNSAKTPRRHYAVENESAEQIVLVLRDARDKASKDEERITILFVDDDTIEIRREGDKARRFLRGKSK